MNNLKRLKQFQLDHTFISKYINNGSVCDVGCSTGEFLRYINWEGEKYGMEISDEAIHAAQDLINFKKNIYSESNYFDLIIFRGTIQHVANPFEMIAASYKALKKGGYIVFLATPNTNSVVYRLNLSLPFLNPELNYYVPGKKELCNALTNFGFSVVDCEFPYWRTPYRNMIKDHVLFFINLIFNKNYKHAFWGNMMNIAAIK